MKARTSGVTPDGTAYDVYGDPKASSVVLIHGMGLCRKMWDKYLPAFSQNYQVINYDLYGHGQSQPMPDKGSLRLFSTQLNKLLEHLEITKTSIAGFSIGGMINRRFAMDYPDLVSGLVILNSPHERDSALQEKAEVQAKKVRQDGRMATMEAAIKRWFTSEALNETDLPEMVSNWRRQCDAESYAQTAWVLANGVRELINPDPALRLPALVMTSENDVGSTPSMSEAISSEIEGSRLEIVPRYRHLGLMENIEPFAEPMVTFLEELNKEFD